VLREARRKAKAKNAVPEHRAAHDNPSMASSIALCVSKGESVEQVGWRSEEGEKCEFDQEGKALILYITRAGREEAHAKRAGFFSSTGGNVRLSLNKRSVSGL
jgi:hypothetical protein